MTTLLLAALLLRPDPDWLTLRRQFTRAYNQCEARAGALSKTAGKASPKVAASVLACWDEKRLRERLDALERSLKDHVTQQDGKTPASFGQASGGEEK